MRPMVAVAMLLLSFSATSLAFTINIVESLKDKPTGKNLEALFTHLYRPLGINPTFVYYPSKRGLNMVNSGEFDAEAIRLVIVGDAYKNLVKVNQQIDSIKAGFICTDKRKCEVQATSAVAVLNGFEGAAKLCAKLNLQCTYVDSIEAIAKMIDNGIADAIFATTFETQYIFCASKTNDLYFKQQQDLKLASFHYLNSKHLNLRPQLEMMLAKMRAEGQMARDTSLKELLSTSCNKSVSIIE